MLLDGEGRPALVIGTRGGRRMLSTTASVVARWALHGQRRETAVPANRFLTDGRRRLERPQLADAVRVLGYPGRIADGAKRAGLAAVLALGSTGRPGR